MVIGSDSTLGMIVGGHYINKRYEKRNQGFLSTVLDSNFNDTSIDQLACSGLQATTTSTWPDDKEARDNFIRTLVEMEEKRETKTKVLAIVIGLNDVHQNWKRGTDTGKTDMGTIVGMFDGFFRRLKSALPEAMIVWCGLGCLPHGHPRKKFHSKIRDAVAIEFNAKYEWLRFLDLCTPGAEEKKHYRDEVGHFSKPVAEELMRRIHATIRICLSSGKHTFPDVPSPS